MMKWCLDCPVPWTQFFFSVKWGEDLSLEQKGTLASPGTKQTTLRSVTSSQTSSAANDAAQMRKPSMEPLCERGLHLSASVGSWNMLKSWKIYGPRSERAEAGRNVYSVWSAGSCGFVTEQGKPLGSKDLMQLGHCQHFLDKPRFFVVEFRCARRNATQNALGERENHGKNTYDDSHTERLPVMFKTLEQTTCRVPPKESERSMTMGHGT